MAKDRLFVGRMDPRALKEYEEDEPNTEGLKAANSIFSNGYLTTPGQSASTDQELLEANGNIRWQVDVPFKVHAAQAARRASSASA